MFPLGSFQYLLSVVTGKESPSWGRIMVEVSVIMTWASAFFPVMLGDAKVAQPADFARVQAHGSCELSTEEKSVLESLKDALVNNTSALGGLGQFIYDLILKLIALFVK